MNHSNKEVKVGRGSKIPKGLSTVLFRDCSTMEKGCMGNKTDFPPPLLVSDCSTMERRRKWRSKYR